MCWGALPFSRVSWTHPWQTGGLCLHPWSNRFQEYWRPSQGKANYALQSFAVGMEKQAYQWLQTISLVFQFVQQLQHGQDSGSQRWVTYLGLINLSPPVTLFAGCMGSLRAVGLCHKPKVVSERSCHLLPALRLPGDPSYPAAVCASPSDPGSSTELGSEGEALWEQPDGLVAGAGHVPWLAPHVGWTCCISSSWSRRGCSGSGSSLEEASPSQCSGSQVGAFARVI